jgi:general secretion pathway protein D
LLLAACASGPVQREITAADVQSAAAVRPLSKPYRVEFDGDQAEDGDVVDQPTLIRGNDKMFAPPKADPGLRLQGPAVSLKFEQAPLAEMVHAVLGDILKLPYAINEAAGGSITLHTQAPLPLDKVFPVFESVLQANGLVVVKDASGVYHVGRADNMRGIAPAFGSAGKLPSGHNMVVVPLRYIGVVEMADILKPVASPEAFVRVDGFRNLLILAGTQGQLNGWMEIINTFDIDILKGMSIGLFPLKHMSVQEVDAGLKAVLAGAGAVGGESAPAPAAPTGRRTAQQAAAPAAANDGGAALQLPSPVAGVLRVVTLERLNALLVITPRAHYLDIAREWIDKFDQPRSSGSGPQLYVYPVQNGTAEHLAELLTSIFGGDSQNATTSRPAQRSVAPGLGSGLLGGSSGNAAGGLTSRLSSTSGNEGGENTAVAVLGDVRVVADKRQNALLIYAPRTEYAKIEAALRKLDVAPTQILIEASILEVTLSDELRFGLQWYFNGRLNSSGSSGSGQLTSGGSDAIGRANPGFSYTITNSLGDVRAVLNALAEKSLLNVISSPSIMVLDNHTAQIHVGDQQPVRSSQVVTDGGNTTSSIQYKDTGVMLTVSPSVNAGGMVTMEVEQSVTDVGQIDAATEQRAFLQRQISSRVAVRDGETIVLGGLIRDNNTKTRQGVPLLHDIPVLGHLFGATTDVKNRTELLVMLTPRVLRNEEDLRQIGDEFKQRMRGLQLLPERISAGFHQSGEQAGARAEVVPLAEELDPQLP